MKKASAAGAAVADAETRERQRGKAVPEEQSSTTCMKLYIITAPTMGTVIAFPAMWPNCFLLRGGRFTHVLERFMEHSATGDS